MRVRRRFILWNILVWVVFLVVGLGILTLARRGGQVVQARAEASQYVAEAALDLQENNWTQADRALYRAALTNPSGAPDFVISFGNDLMVLPKALNRLRTECYAITDPSAKANYAQGVLRLLERDVAAAEQRFIESAEAGYGPAALAAGRLALDEGDWDSAERYFSAYWSAYPEQRQERIALFAGERSNDPDALLDSALGLFADGLWETALAYSERAEQSVDDVAGLAVFDAVRADVHGSRDEARRLYEAALESAPDHYYASRRLAFLKRR